MVPVAIGERPRPGADAAAVARLRSALASSRPDVVHAHGVRAGAFSALALALLRRSARPALVVTVHNAPPDGPRARFVYGALERICARRADLVLCASPDLLARIRSLGAASAELFDVPAAAGGGPAGARPWSRGRRLTCTLTAARLCSLSAGSRTRKAWMC